jgi:hypothetical protein
LESEEIKMLRTQFHSRRAVQIENESIRVTVLEEGGHVAEITEKGGGINPLWIPPWPSIEVSSWTPAHALEYGESGDGKLLAGIMGHSLCLDMFGPPSPAEEAAGLGLHGEAGEVLWAISEIPNGLLCRCTLPYAQLEFERKITLLDNTVKFQERVTNIASLDRPIAWTEHVTLGPPFLESGRTQFLASTSPLWPAAPLDSSPGKSSAAQLNSTEPDILSHPDHSGGYAAYLMDESRPFSFFAAWSPTCRTAITYKWRTSDFPWLGVWDENRSRTQAPWSGQTLARGMEFGVSPFPEPRRQMIDRHSLFNRPTYRWISARSSLAAEYEAAISHSDSLPNVA